MKVLLSAYECRPDEGSEPGIGWGWVKQLLLNGHEVWVLTKKSNQRAIEKKLALSPLEQVHFVYYDLPRVVHWWFLSNLWPFRIWPFESGKYLLWHIWHFPYHFFWQYFAYQHVKPISSAQNFDLVHHVTFATLTRSSFMGELGMPFFFGPGGGGERAPFRIRTFLNVKHWLFEFLRDFSILLAKINPFLWRAFSKATIIYATTEQSKKIVPTWYRTKVIVKSQLGIDESVLSTSDRKRVVDGAPIRFLYVGRFIYWKGLDLGIKAFGKLCHEFDNVELTLIGNGPEEGGLRSIVEHAGVSENIHWLPWVKQSELASLYLDHDVFLFPSLHDSGGLAVIEAMASYLPVICLDLGGPATSVNNHCGIVVETIGKNPDNVADGIYRAMREIVLDTEKRERLSCGAYKRAKDFTWPALTSSIINPEIT